MDVLWNYYPENFMFAEQQVATMSKKDGTEILHVFEDKGFHYTELCSDFKFLNPYKVSFRTESIMICGISDLNQHLEDIHLDRLKAGCSLIEDNFMEQINTIKRVLN